MKKVYLSRKSYVRFDDDHLLLYIGEQKVENYHPETSGTSDTESEASDSGKTAFSYEGDEADGSTKIKAKSATYGDFTAGLVRTKYSQNQVEAILANRGDGDKSHEAEFDAYQAWRIQAKQIAQEVLAREL